MVHRTGEYWYCTRDTSVVLAALADYLVSRPPKPGNGDVKVSINGAPYRSVTLSAPHYKEPELIVRIPSSSLKSGKNEIKLERTAGSGTVFYSMQLRQTIASEDMAAAAPAGYTITREYLRIKPGHDSEYSWRMKTEPTNNRLQSGDRIRVRLTIDIPKDMSYVLIEDPFPSGCEVTERGSADQEIETWSFWYSNVDVRDDRIAFFARSIPAGKHVLEYNLRAQTPGQCHVLPTILESMYAPELHAESAETRVEVK